jgi:poly(3-hydroxybutyrate) depolymerase
MRDSFSLPLSFFSVVSTFLHLWSKLTVTSSISNMGFLISTLLLSSLQLLVACLPQSQAHLRNHITSRAASGCGKSQFLPGVTQYRFGLKSSGKDRSYSYHLPSNYDKNKKYPVVVGFHGSSSVGAFFELDTKMSEARYSSDKIMVYPNGIEGSWAGPTYHNGSTVTEDIQYVADLIVDVKGRMCVEDGEVFAVG